MHNFMYFLRDFAVFYGHIKYGIHNFIANICFENSYTKECFKDCY